MATAYPDEPGATAAKDAATPAGARGAGRSPAAARRHPEADGGRRPDPASGWRAHRALAHAALRASAGAHRRGKAQVAKAAAQAAAARAIGRMARRQARHSVSAHRSAQGRARRCDGHDVERVRRAVSDPAGRRRSRNADGGHRRAVRAVVGRRAVADPEARDPASCSRILPTSGATSASSSISRGR